MMTIIKKDVTSQSEASIGECGLYAYRGYT